MEYPKVEYIKNKQCKTCKNSDFASFSNWFSSFYGGGCSNRYAYPCKKYEPNSIGKMLLIFKKK